MPTRWLNLKLDDSTGEPFVRRPYVLTWRDQRVEGRTDAHGRISVPVPGDLDGASLYVAHRRFDLRFDALPAVDTVVGAQARLNQLNFHVGPEDDDLGPRTQAAIRAFQVAQRLEPTGALDEATQKALRAAHGT